MSDNSERVRQAITKDIYAVSTHLKETGYESFEVKYDTVAKVETTCRDCLLTGYLWPEVQTVTMYVQWYGVDNEGNKKLIAEKEAKREGLLFLFTAPFVFPFSVYRAFSSEYPDATFNQKLSGKPLILNSIINMNRKIVLAIQSGDLKLPKVGSVVPK